MSNCRGGQPDWQLFKSTLKADRVPIIWNHKACKLFTKIRKNNLFGFTRLIEKSEFIKNCIVGVGILTIATYIIKINNPVKIYMRNNDLLYKLQKQDETNKILEKNQLNLR